MFYEVVDRPSHRRQLVQICEDEDVASSVQVETELHPSSLGWADDVLTLSPHLHEFVDNDAHAQVHEEHEAEQDPHHEEQHPDWVRCVPQRLHVRRKRSVASSIHGVDPALCRRDFDQSEHRVPDVVKVVTQNLLPSTALFGAERRILHQRRAEVRALARGPVFRPTRQARPRIRAAAASVDAEVRVQLGLELAALDAVLVHHRAVSAAAAVLLAWVSAPQDALSCRTSAGHDVRRLHRRDVKKSDLFLKGAPVWQCGDVVAAGVRQLLRDRILPRAQVGRCGVRAVELRPPQWVAAGDADRRVRRGSLPRHLERGVVACPAQAAGVLRPGHGRRIPLPAYHHRLQARVAEAQGHGEGLEVWVSKISVEPDIALTASIQRPVQVHHEDESEDEQEQQEDDQQDSQLLHGIEDRLHDVPQGLQALDHPERPERPQDAEGFELRGAAACEAHDRHGHDDRVEPVPCATGAPEVGILAPHHRQSDQLQAHLRDEDHREDRVQGPHGGDDGVVGVRQREVDDHAHRGDQDAHQDEGVENFHCAPPDRNLLIQEPIGESSEREVLREEEPGPTMGPPSPALKRPHVLVVLIFIVLLLVVFIVLARLPALGNQAMLLCVAPRHLPRQLRPGLGNLRSRGVRLLLVSVDRPVFQGLKFLHALPGLGSLHLLFGIELFVLSIPEVVKLSEQHAQEQAQEERLPEQEQEHVQDTKGPLPVVVTRGAHAGVHDGIPILTGHYLEDRHEAPAEIVVVCARDAVLLVVPARPLLCQGSV
mmetsp:Transcript_142619/g.355463  ORF Transcript_142619/g.355463 Transcript_142619/m.355463 type:complete len:767 (-) Transcript_142619:302-2602(-)